MKLTASVTIETSSENAWEMISQPAALILWQQGYESTVMEAGNPLEVGSKALHSFTEKGKKATVKENILEIDAPLKKVSELEYPVMAQRVTIEIIGSEPVNVQLSVEFSMKAFSLKVMWPWLKKSFQAKLEDDLNRLKGSLEIPEKLEE